MATEATSLRNERLVLVEVEATAQCPFCGRVLDCRVNGYGALEIKACCSHAVGAERLEGGLFIQFVRTR